MLLLPEPYGYEQGHHISLQCKSRKFDIEKVISILENYSCYPPAIPKIISSLQHSGRYDCVLQALWFNTQCHFVTKELNMEGIDLLILRLKEGDEIRSLEESVRMQMRYGNDRYRKVVEILAEEIGWES